MERPHKKWKPNVCVFVCYISSIISYNETTCWVNDYVPGKALQDGWRCGRPVIKRSCLDTSHIATVLMKHTQHTVHTECSFFSTAHIQILTNVFEQIQTVCLNGKAQWRDESLQCRSKYLTYHQTSERKTKLLKGMCCCY